MRSLRRLLPLVATVLAVTAPTALAAGDCPKGFSCSTVDVPLDRSGGTPGTLELPVIVERGRGPVLLVLAGGPGQGANGFVAQARGLFDRTAPGHRIASVDQRGTGPTALRCREMQRAALTDLTVPPPGSVDACATRLGGDRAFFTTGDTVADLEAVREELGLERWALQGTSYGTYVAERYARAHPDRVARLVLDSVVPQENVDPFFAASMRRAGIALRQLCAGGACRPYTATPAADLRRLVQRVERDPLKVRMRLAGTRLTANIDGPALFDLSISLASFLQADFATFPAVVRAALDDRPGPLRRLYRGVRELQLTGPEELSWGLHTATLCADVRFPWGTATAPLEGRGAAVDLAVREQPAGHFGPFGRITARGNGALVTCRGWAPVDVAPTPAPGPLPDVPILMLNGTWDLSTPVEDARREARRSPTARLVVLPEVGHSTITAQPCAQRIVRRFFLDRPLGTPCAGHRAPRMADVLPAR